MCKVIHANNTVFYPFWPGPTDYCEHEHFEAKCGEGQEVMMQSATYGRMRVGRCIDMNYHIGCAMDVLLVMDGFCSGKQDCSVPIGHPILLSTKLTSKVCSKSLSAYLTSSYMCINSKYIYIFFQLLVLLNIHRIRENPN